LKIDDARGDVHAEILLQDRRRVKGHSV
jgi:hypothetical protein